MAIRSNSSRRSRVLWRYEKQTREITETSSPYLLPSKLSSFFVLIVAERRLVFAFWQTSLVRLNPTHFYFGFFCCQNNDLGGVRCPTCCITGSYPPEHSWRRLKGTSQHTACPTMTSPIWSSQHFVTTHIPWGFLRVSLWLWVKTGKAKQTSSSIVLTSNLTELFFTFTFKLKAFAPHSSFHLTPFFSFFSFITHFFLSPLWSAVDACLYIPNRFVLPPKGTLYPEANPALSGNNVYQSKQLREIQVRKKQDPTLYSSPPRNKNCWKWFTSMFLCCVWKRNSALSNPRRDAKSRRKHLQVIDTNIHTYSSCTRQFLTDSLSFCCLVDDIPAPLPPTKKKTLLCLFYLSRFQSGLPQALPAPPGTMSYAENFLYLLSWWVLTNFVFLSGLHKNISLYLWFSFFFSTLSMSLVSPLLICIVGLITLCLCLYISFFRRGLGSMVNRTVRTID